MYILFFVILFLFFLFIFTISFLTTKVSFKIILSSFLLLLIIIFRFKKNLLSWLFLFPFFPFFFFSYLFSSASPSLGFPQIPIIICCPSIINTNHTKFSLLFSGLENSHWFDFHKTSCTKLETIVYRIDHLFYRCIWSYRNFSSRYSSTKWAYDFSSHFPILLFRLLA